MSWTKAHVRPDEQAPLQKDGPPPHGGRVVVVVVEVVVVVLVEVVVAVSPGHGAQHALSSPEPQRAAPLAPQNVPAGHSASVVQALLTHPVVLLSRQTRPPAPQCVTQ